MQGIILINTCISSFKINGLFMSLHASTLHNKMEWLSRRWDTSSMSLELFFIIIMFQKNFWGEVILTTAYLINRVPSRVLGNNSHFQCISTFFPSLNLHTPLPFRVFGCVAFVHVPPHTWDKLDPRALRCLFLGYSPTQKGYKCYYPPTRKFLVSKDVTFVESQPYFGHSTLGLQGENHTIEDHVSNLLPSQDLGPHSSTSIDSKHSIPNPVMHTGFVLYLRVITLSLSQMSTQALSKLINLDYQHLQ